MTINGPAPMILAMFFNAAARQQARKRLIESGRLDAPPEAAFQPLVDGKDWEALAPLLEDGEWDEILKTTMQMVRGTVQADILKEDQAQNTCIFSTEFALRMMGDIQQLFCDWKVNNFYSVSISRLPHCRGRREPPHPARLHPGQRLHLCRNLSRPRHAHRRLRPQPELLLQ